MTGQDEICLLLPVPMHDDREHKQVMPAPTAPVSPRTLSKQLYYGSIRSDVPSVTLPCVQQQLLASQLQQALALWPSSSTMAAQDVIRILLLVQLYEDREHKQLILAPTAPTSTRILS